MSYGSAVEIGSPRDTLQYVRRTMIPWLQWDLVADSVAKRLAAARPDLRGPGLQAPALAAALASLKESAVAPLGQVLAPAQTDEIAAYLRAQPGFAGHHMTSSDGRERPYADIVAEGGRYVAYRPETVVKAPHAMALANRPEILDLVEAALGCPPTLYSVSAWWSFPVAGEPWPPHSQHFHRDDDDFRFFTLFVYLTDVDSEFDGPNQIVPGSHTLSGMNALIADAATAGRLVPDQAMVNNLLTQWPQPTTLVENAFAPRIVSTLGPRGTGFFADTRTLHRGFQPRERVRGILWFRFGLGPNSNSSDVDLVDGPVPVAAVGSAIPDTPRHRYVNRLLVRWD
ncbi:MAG: phytanoyl-CoA dioxygenase family protein [Magnetospirillum sp.]|nr:phytanoyl-CoA dioxygenase family protein [Magnetospirillum sp.]